MSADLDGLKAWVGRSREQHDTVDAVRLAGMSATLDRDDAAPRPGDPLPPCWHWMLFHDHTAQRALDADGHAARGSFMPPVPLPRRMWAGGRLTFEAAPAVGQAVTMRSEVLDVTPKRGKTGDLVFVVVRHRILVDGCLAIEEERDIVYRAATSGAGRAPKPAPPDADWQRTIRPDPAMLFRYSALTFNAHRIHYDLPYCKTEGYPGLVVHGPLTATLLLDLCRRSCPEREIAQVAFRAVAPLFAPEPFSVAGRRSDDGATLWAANADGGLAMEATVRFA